MSATPREIGTLIVVVLRANHLPNKRHIGKQDPYCVITLNGERRRTKAIKRGGQHPEWDEEVRFTLYEDAEDLLARNSVDNDLPPPLPPKDDTLLGRVQGGKTLKLACYADDFREPDFIGEAHVDLTEVLTKGETDEWFTLMNKDKFAGKVYLELTFYSNEPAPLKRGTPTIQATNNVYGGPGSFTPNGANNAASQPRAVSTSNIYDQTHHDSGPVPSSLRTSHSLARLDVYAPSIDSRGYTSAVEQLTNDLAEFGVQEPRRRRETLPPIPTTGYSTQQTYGYAAHDTAAHADGSMYAQYKTSYEGGSTTIYHPPPTWGPRHSIPTSSSGFMPLSSSASSLATQSGVNTPQPPPSQTPAPYLTTHFTSQPTPIPTAPPASYTPAPISYPPATTPSYIIPQSYLPQQYQYPLYTTPPIPNTPYVDSQPQPQAPVPASSTVPALYQAYTPTLVAPPPQDATLHSRPLPQQPPVASQIPPPPPPLNHAHPPYTLTTSASVPPQTRSYSPSVPASAFTTSISYQTVPPPPPLPPVPITPPRQNSNNSPSLPPFPPPGPSLTPSPHRQPTLPQPPMPYQHHAYTQNLPPPPPPPFIPPPPPPPLSQDTPLTFPTHPSGQGPWATANSTSPPLQHNSYTHLPLYN